MNSTTNDSVIDLMREVATLKTERDAILRAANALIHQIDIGDFVDSHGHNAKMLKAVHDLLGLLTDAQGEVK